MEAEADCDGNVKCEGSCSGECSGGCEGNATPPSCSANCDASADCQASASAQASAEFTCTPPSLDIGFQLSAAAEADGAVKAAFLAKMEIYKEKMVAILQGLTEVRFLVDGNAETGAEAPVVTLKNELQGLGEAAITGDFDVAVGLVPCTLDAISEVPSVVSKIGTDSTAVLQGSVSLVAIIGM